MNIVEYDASGKILSVVNYPVSDRAVTEFPLYQERLFLPQGCVVDWDRHYVKDGELADRPELTVSFDGKLLRDVPKAAVITIDETDYMADGSDSIELEFAPLTTHRIKVTLWPYQDKEFLHEDIPQG